MSCLQRAQTLHSSSSEPKTTHVLLNFINSELVAKIKRRYIMCVIKRLFSISVLSRAIFFHVNWTFFILEEFYPPYTAVNSPLIAGYKRIHF